MKWPPANPVRFIEPSGRITNTRRQKIGGIDLD